ncbi:hypothetical protein MRX96_040936 [Rhipicephalus microplus]
MKPTQTTGKGRGAARPAPRASGTEEGIRRQGGSRVVGTDAIGNVEATGDAVVDRLRPRQGSRRSGHAYPSQGRGDGCGRKGASRSRRGGTTSGRRCGFRQGCSCVPGGRTPSSTRSTDSRRREFCTYNKLLKCIVLGARSGAEPVPAANPLLIFSVLVSYFLFVAACFLIIKYAYHGYDVNAPDVHTVTSKEIHAPLQFDEQDLEDRTTGKARRFTDGHTSGRSRGSKAAHGRRRKAGHGRRKKGARKPARTKRLRRGSTASAWENEWVTMLDDDLDSMAETLDSTATTAASYGRLRTANSTRPTSRTVTAPLRPLAEPRGRKN